MMIIIVIIAAAETAAAVVVVVVVVVFVFFVVIVVIFVTESQRTSLQCYKHYNKATNAGDRKQNRVDVNMSLCEKAPPSRSMTVLLLLLYTDGGHVSVRRGKSHRNRHHFVHQRAAVSDEIY